MAKQELLDIDLRLLKIFQTIVEEGGLTQAANELNVSTSTISVQLSGLEVRLGVQLCLRGRGGFSLTDEGRSIYEAYRDLREDIGRFSETVGEICGSLVGNLRLSIFSGVLNIKQVPLVRSIQKFKDRSAYTHISLDIQPVNSIEQAILNESVDLGMAVFQREIPGVHQREIAEENMYLYCGKEHRLFDRALTSRDVNEVESCERCFRDYLRFARGTRRKPQNVNTTKANELESLAIMILTGRFLGVLPDHYAKPWVTNGEMRAILPDKFCYKNTIVLLTKREKKLPKTALAFLDDFEAELANA